MCSQFFLDALEEIWVSPSHLTHLKFKLVLLICIACCILSALNLYAAIRIQPKISKSETNQTTQT